MKLKDITIKNIYDYLKSHSDFKIELSEEKDVSKQSDSVLRLKYPLKNRKK